MISDETMIQVELLLKSGADGEPSAYTIANFHPDSGHIESVYRWLNRQGLTAYATDLSVVCVGPQRLIEQAFAIRLPCPFPRSV